MLPKCREQLYMGNYSSIYCDILGQCHILHNDCQNNVAPSAQTNPKDKSSDGQKLATLCSFIGCDNEPHLDYRNHASEC